MKADTETHFISGVFNVPKSGAWRVTFSVEAELQKREETTLYLYHNSNDVSPHHTCSGNNNDDDIWVDYSGHVVATSGRMRIVDASVGDLLQLWTYRMTGALKNIHFCVEYIPKM